MCPFGKILLGRYTTINSLPIMNISNISKLCHWFNYYDLLSYVFFFSTLDIKEWFGFGESLSWSSNLIVAIKLCFVMIVFMVICKFLSCFECCKKK